MSYLDEQGPADNTPSSASGPSGSGDWQTWSAQHWQGADSAPEPASAPEPTPSEPSAYASQPAPIGSVPGSVPGAAGPVSRPYGSPAPEQPLPVCDYTTESETPCEEPALQKRWSGFAVVTAATLGAVTGGLLVAIVAAFAFGAIPGVKPVATVQPTPVARQNVTITPTGNENVAAAVAKKVTPSIVNVTVQQQGFDPSSGQSGYQDVGNGSGVIVRQDGYILTNNHVVEGADRIVVRVGVQDKVAKVVGTDPTTDLAVIKIDGSGYPAVEWGTSKDLQVGDFVAAIGSPFGLEHTVTSGIVSALQRSEIAQRSGSGSITNYTDLIQTDAAINPGNSGGALVDSQGRLVGINTLIQSPSGQNGAAQSAGIGFAIPADFARVIADQLISQGKAVHPFLGISSQTVDDSLLQQVDLPVKTGALVRFVQPGSPADTAGIRQDDVIVKIGDRTITGSPDVFAAIRQYKVGQAVPVQVVRGNTTHTFTATLGSDAQTQSQ